MLEQQAARAQQAAQQAEARYMRVRQVYVSCNQQTSPLFRDHPLNDERVETVIAVADFVDGKRQFNTLPAQAQTVIQTLGDVEGQQGRAPAAPSRAMTQFCPAGGEQYPSNVTTCPVHHVKLRPLQE